MEEDKTQQAEDEKSANVSIRKKISDAYGKLGISPIPHMYAPEGITFDFCWGYRIFIPDNSVREKYRVRVWDLDDEHLCFDGIVGCATWVQSDEHYFKRYAIEIDDGITGEKVFAHKFDLKDKTVLISFPVETVGDTLAWFASVPVFQRKHGCKVIVAMAKHMRKLLEPANPDIRFIEREEMRTVRAYAFYMEGICFDGNPSMQPYDWRLSPLHWAGANLLGIAEGGRVIEEPYVCIGTMASGGCKLWLNPDGWDNVVKFLKEAGYRVIDIDGTSCTGEGITYQKIPAGAEDWTGKGEGKELADRARLLRDCDFFIGVGSGLSWLAWAMRKPVVLISGFSLPFCEFHTPYRVINTYVCHGCFNDVRYEFNGKDCFWCPKHKNDDQHLICSLAITAAQVRNKIKEIPEYNKQIERKYRETQGLPEKDGAPLTHTVIEEVSEEGVGGGEWKISPKPVVSVFPPPTIQRDGKLAENAVQTPQDDKDDAKERTVFTIRQGEDGAQGMFIKLKEMLERDEPDDKDSADTSNTEEKR